MSREEQLLNAIFGGQLKTEINTGKDKVPNLVENMFVEEFYNAYTKDNLSKGILKFVKAFYEKERVFCLEKGINPQIVDFFIGKKGNITKDEILQVCLPVLNDKERFLKFRDSLPFPVQTVLYEILWVDSLTEFEIEKIISFPPYKDENDRWRYTRELDNEWYFFVVRSGDNYNLSAKKHKYHLSLPDGLKKTIKSYYPVPENSILKPVSDEIIKQKGKVFNGEVHLLQDMMKIIAYHLQDNLKFSTRGKPNASSVNKMRKTLKLTEFYEENEDLGNIRSYLFAMMMADFTKKEMREDIATQIKTIFKRLEADNMLVEMILSNLKGFHQLWENYYVSTTPEISFILKQIPPNEWFSMQNLEMNIKYHQLNLNPVRYDYGLNNYIYYEEKVPHSYGSGYYSEKNYIKTSRASIFISFPFLKGMLFTMATLGMLDIVYNEPSLSEFGKTYYSDYDGIQYFRLTPLGMYVLDRTTTYESNVSTAGGKLVFSEDSLILLAEGDVSLYEVLLRNYAERVTDTRFRVTYQSFLKDCKSKKELKQKIDIFRQTVSRNLPANWEAFLTDLDYKSKVFIPKNDLHVFQIPQKDRDLQRLIAQDKNLKELVIKAEDFIVLIKKDNLTKFKNRLKEFGYIVD